MKNFTRFFQIINWNLYKKKKKNGASKSLKDTDIAIIYKQSMVWMNCSPLLKKY